MLQQKGEQIFEDDGSGQIATGNSNYEVPCKFPNDVYEDNIEIKKSFEVFQGKLYYNSKLQSLGDHGGSTSLSTRLTRLIDEYILIKNEIDSVADKNKSDDSTIWLALQDTAKSHIEDLQKQKSQTISKSQTIDLNNEISSILAPAQEKSVDLNYHQVQNMTTSKMDDVDIVKLDRRISTIESIVGSTTSLTIPLTKTVFKLDSQLTSLSSIDDLNQKLSNLKTELGTIIKSQREVKLIEGAIAIKNMNNKLNQLNDISSDLPVIASRLKMLDGVHRSSLGYLNRLRNIEAMSEKITNSLATNEQVLRTLKSVSIENLSLLLFLLLLLLLLRIKVQLIYVLYDKIGYFSHFRE